MKEQMISITGARTHNLRNVSLDIPKNRLVVFTGLSGSGKSSLVFDTIHTEAQRQLIETFSSFARRRLPKLSRPDVDEIKNIGTSIVIDQKRMGRTMRSTVGTATELSTYLRMLFSRCGKTPDAALYPSFFFSFNHPEGMCPSCSGLGKRIQVDTSRLLDRTKSLKEGAVTHPDFKVGGWNWRELLATGLFQVDLPLEQWSEKDLETLLYADKIPVQRAHAAGSYLKYHEGLCTKLERLYVNKAEEDLPETRKNAYSLYFTHQDCTDCGGHRLNRRALGVTVEGFTIAELSSMELSALDGFLSSLAGRNDKAADLLVFKMRRILSHLIGIGVGYLSLSRAVATLSGGESQRVKMARQLDCDLVDLMYILDEPTTGLHPCDSEKLIALMRSLRDKGNSVLVVEHDPDVIMSADWVVDIGPGAGVSGGHVLFAGEPSAMLASGSVTGHAISAGRLAQTAGRKRREWKDSYRIEDASIHNLRSVSCSIPKGVLTCVTGVAGSGKSSLIGGVFVPSHPEAVVIDQTAITGNSRSTPASYIGVFDLMRKEFSAVTGKKPGLFSFNSEGGCPKCGGSGCIQIEMSFLDDVRMVCDECGGKRYNEEALAVSCRGKNISEVLAMTPDEAAGFFTTKEIARRLKVLSEVGLDYISIGQPLSTLSGGECQRLKLATELHKKGGLYVMDEPTTGLHLNDIGRLLAIVDRLVRSGNTVIVIEHNIDFIRAADWVIDMGPGGGKDGGRIVASGTPETVAKNRDSVTGRYLMQ